LIWIDLSNILVLRRPLAFRGVFVFLDNMIIKSLMTPAAMVTVLFCLTLAGTAGAQDLKQRYIVVNRLLTPGADPGSIHLNEVDGVGIAWLRGKEFTTGSIEFDIKGKDVLQHSFVGVAFHGVDDTTYEAVYFRPFNFRATDPVRKAHAVQYIASPNYDWPRLRADYPNKYEQPLSPAPDPEQWIHVRMLVESKKISVYVNNSKQPALTVEPPLVNTNGKKIGIWAGNTSGGDWKNLKITL
jgi:hypothetical protein